MPHNSRNQIVRTRTENRQHIADLEQFDLEVEELIAQVQYEYEDDDIS